MLLLVSVRLSHNNGIIIVRFKSDLNQCFYVFQLLKYDGNIVIKYVFSMPCCGKDFSNPSCQVYVEHSLSNENKTFCSPWNLIFELGIFSFNSYVCYLTRAFNLLTSAFNLPTCTFNLLTRAFNLPTRAFNLPTVLLILQLVLSLMQPLNSQLGDLNS